LIHFYKRMTTVREACFLCDRICADKCPDCGQVFACSPQHLQVHRGGKKCLPWVVKFQEGVGRTLVANRDILPFELVMQDNPLVKVVDADQFCVNCGEKLEGEECTPCVCGCQLCQGCYSDSEDHQIDCSMLAAVRNLGDMCTEPFMISKLLEIARLYRLKLSSPEKWNWLNRFMSHQKERNESKEFRTLSEIFLHVLHKAGLDTVDKTSLDHLLGILDTNSISSDSSMQLLFPYLSLASHSCIPNCEHWITGTRATLRAKRKIVAGEEVTIRYSYLSLHRNLLQTVISNAWHFSCCCARCCDVTEVGTRASHFKCNKCREGLLQDSGDCYQCGVCDENMSLEEVRNRAALLRSYEVSTPLEKIPTVIVEMEAKGGHPLYHSVIELKLQYIEGITKKSLNEPICKIVMEYSKDICRYMDKLNPGVSMMRGRVLFCMAKVNNWFLKTCTKDTESGERVRGGQEVVKMMILAKKMISGYVT